jgi:hypothetical protein
MSIKQMAAAPMDVGLTDLSIIGVPNAAQNRWPTLTGFPQKFNKEALVVWKEVVESPDFKAQMKAWGTKDAAWHNAIIQFLSACEDKGVFPFPNNTDTTRNEFIQDFVRRGRISLVNFANESGLFTQVRVRKAYREYVRKDTGLVFSCWAELFPVKDPNFEKWLTTSPMPRFLKHVDNRYVKVVQPNVNMWVRYLNPARVTVGFTIEVPGTINIPGKKTPKRKEVDSWIDRVIWYPIVRAHRFADVRNRLF